MEPSASTLASGFVRSSLSLFPLLSKKTMNIYVANIPFKATSDQLKGLFEAFGEVSSAKIILDKFTQRSRGFGFVEMSDDAAARQAMDELNGSDVMGKSLVVNGARPRTAAPRSGGGSRGGNFNRRNY